MHYRKLYNSDWKMIEERIEKKLISAHKFSFNKSRNVYVVPCLKYQ
jgi:hypothetical protein